MVDSEVLLNFREDIFGHDKNWQVSNRAVIVE